MERQVISAENNLWGFYRQNRRGEERGGEGKGEREKGKKIDRFIMEIPEQFQLMLFVPKSDREKNFGFHNIVKTYF